MEQLVNEIGDLTKLFGVKVTINNLPFDINKCTDLAKKILRYIEEDYLQIFENKDIIDALDISEAKLNLELQNNNLPSCKKIILFFKINHSILLMKNKGLNLTEIAEFSGFTNNKRFGECFMRLYGITPKVFRIKMDKSKNENSNYR